MSLIDDLKKMTVPQLRSYAKKNNINLDGVSKKNEILEVIFSFIPKEEDAIPTPEQRKQPKETVAVFSERNLSWSGVGTLTRGYNIIAKEASDQWLRHKAVRQASPEEVARHYGK